MAMRGNWKRRLILLAVFAAGVVQVSDVYAIWPFRRRVGIDGYAYRPAYRTTTVYGTAPAMPAATVTAPGVGVTTGPGGASVAAPGVGVNAGRAGANVNAPG